MTQEDLKYIKDAFSQIIDDIAGNPDWQDAAIAVASDIRTLESELNKRTVPLPSNLDEAAISRMRDPDMYLSDATIDEIGDELLKMAHFGAEWMAEQGVSMVITDETEWAEVDKFVHSNCDGASVIQIRKKD